MKYIDLHTHRVKELETIQIQNIFAQDLIQGNPQSLFSTGLHPWHIEKVNPMNCFQMIEQVAELNNMLAVGECGLDRSIATDFELQKMCFKDQIRIAEQCSKPLIIHCVRAYSDLICLKKEAKSEVPWILHAYQGNNQTTRNLIEHGFYFSVGEPILKMSAKHDILRMIPLERLFLETDDREISIRTTYSLASEVLNISENQLTQVISSNFRILFGVKN
jgi:TatD DNase family protein